MRPVFALLALLPLPLAAVELPALFSDHAVLQAGNDTPVWGRGRDGESITVTLAGISATTTVAHGTWMVHLHGLQASPTPQEVVVQGDTTVRIHDVLIGDVWICSGQSNMEWNVGQSHNGAEVAPQATDTGLRLFRVAHATSRTPRNDVHGQWVVCSPQTVTTFSAVGYHFGRALRAQRATPMGLIGTHWGGTPAQAWTSTEALTAAPAFTNYLDAQATFDRDYPRAKAEWPKTKATYDAELKAARAANAAAEAAWVKAAAAAKAAGQPEPTKPKPQPEPKRVIDPDGNPWIPANLFNGMVAPLIPYGITGAIWYQGESNAGAADEYATLFPRMISDWRSRWGRGDFPFLFVHLSTWNPAQQEPVEHQGIPQVRQTQQAALALPNTGMATALDIHDGPNIHPGNKQLVGERLANVARKVAYGEDVPCDSPRLHHADVQGAEVRVTLTHAQGLRVAAPPWLGPKAAKPSATEPSGFAICGADGVWKWAKARIEGETLVISSADVPQPVAAAHAWAPDPSINVYNGAGLPLLPFVTDPARLPPLPSPK